MKLKWKYVQSNLRTSKSTNGLEYRIEISHGITGTEINARVTNEYSGRTLGWCPSVQLAKDRCQLLENYFSDHQISLV